MSFHGKVFSVFLAFHVVVTVGGLLADEIRLMNGAYSDNDPYIPMMAVAMFWVILCVSISMVGLALAYLIRAMLQSFRRL